MKILVACDSYKGCLTSYEVEEQIQKGILRANPHHEVQCFPMADGGEGTAEVLCQIYKGTMTYVLTKDAYGRDILASMVYCIPQKNACLDVASCIGLNMVEKEYRNPMIASSKGVGLMMQDAIQRGYKKIIIGLGGSSTNDGGMGILSAFGVRFFDSHRKELKPSLYALNKISFIDKRHFSFPKDVEIILACDVNNRLLGKEGCTYVFGRQKGIFPNQMEEIDTWMTHYRDKILQTFHVDIDTFAGGGAAGGIGSILLGIFHAKQVSGIELIMESSGFEKALVDADLVITGEGQTDAQTILGKVPFGIATKAKEYDVPVICLSGALGKGYEALYDYGVVSILSTADRAMSFQTALKTSSVKLEALAYSVTRLIDRTSQMK